MERSSLRHRLDRQLRTDADFDAFCIDYFPEVHRRFSSGMSRTEKQNLLFQVVEEHDRILKCLETAQSGTDLPRRNVRRAMFWLAALAMVGALVGVGLTYHHLRNKAALPPALKPPVNVTPPPTPQLPATVEANSENEITDSPDARMHNHAELPIPQQPLRLNSGNRIKGSPGAVMTNQTQLRK
jgi:hypothetical protein